MQVSRTPGQPYAEERIMQFTEIVYFDADGNEVGRDAREDASWHDTREVRDLTEDELADWIEE